MRSLLIIDGHNLLFKAFHGLPIRTTSSGQVVHGIVGFVSITKKIFRIVSPSHMLVVFDGDVAPLRSLHQPSYKSNRPDYGNLPDAENPFTQLAGVKSALDKMEIVWHECTLHEADDVIASVAMRAECDTVIVSSDTDFYQLVSHKVSVLRYRGRCSELVDLRLFQSKLGIEPGDYVMYKSLVGDRSDNIDGVYGIGPKRAVSIIKGDLELNSSWVPLVSRNMELIRLQTDVAVRVEPEEMECDSRAILSYALDEIFRANL